MAKQRIVEKQGRLYSIRYENVDEIQPNSLYTIADVRQLLQCSERQVYVELENGLRWSKVGGKRMVLGSDLLAWAKGRRGSK